MFEITKRTIMLEKYFFSFVLLSSSILLNSCVKERTSNCGNSGCQVTYKYTYHNGEGDLIGSEIDKITVFVFDENEVFLDRFTFTSKDFPSNYAVKIPLPAGNYKLISIGGSLNSYIIGDKNGMTKGLTAGESLLEDFRIILKHSYPVTGPITGLPFAETPSELFYSKDYISVDDSKPLSYNIEFIKNNSTVLFRIVEKFYDNIKRTNTRVDMPYTLYCTGKSNLLDCENNIPAAETTEIKYIPYSIMEQGNTYEARIDNMRLIAGQPVNVFLQFEANGKMLVNEDLMSFIFAKNSPYLTQSDLDKEDFFIIDLEIDKHPENSDVTITIKINGWTVSIVKPEFKS